MKKLLAKLPSTPLSKEAQRSGLKIFMGRIGLSVMVFPLAGGLLGLIINQLWPGAIPWASALALLGLALGIVYLWFWMKKPHP
jgi:predicted F0F1-ATPase subunit